MSDGVYTKENPSPPGGEENRPVKTRWVGAVTVALGLIAAGVLLVAWVFAPGLDMLLIARLSPVLLVLFGVEILLAGLRHRGERVRVNFFAGLMGLVLIVGSLTASVVPQLVRWREEGERVSRRLSAELSDESHRLMQEEGVPVSSVEWYVDVESGPYTAGMGPMEIKTEQYVQVRVYMPGEYGGASGFAEACRRVADVLQTQVPHIDYASFYAWRETEDERHSGDERYSLWLTNRWRMAEGAEVLAQDVVTEYWLPQEGRYMDAWEREDRLENPEGEGAYEEGGAADARAGDGDAAVG